MALPGQLNIALKEWASVCRAMEEGRQILLLRKGGIHESGGEFEVEHPQFLLFPTYLHQNLQMLKPNEHAGFEAKNAEPSQISLSAAGEVTDVLLLKERRQMDAIYAHHIWQPPLIDMRFSYKPQNPLYLMMVRVYQLANAITVENTPAYAGCKSWVPLTQAVDLAGAKPALNDQEFESKRNLIRQKLSAALT